MAATGDNPQAPEGFLLHSGRQFSFESTPSPRTILGHSPAPVLRGFPNTRFSAKQVGETQLWKGGVQNESASPSSRTLCFCGERRRPHPEFVPGDVGKVGQEGKKKIKGQSGWTTSTNHLMLLLWVSPTLVAVKLWGAGCSSWGSCCAASLGSPVH